MAIQDRLGSYDKFDPDKLLPGEWATVISGDPKASDGRAVYKCFDPGRVKRMATYEDMEENVGSASTDIVEKVKTEFTAEMQEATQSAKSAASNANGKASAAQSAAVAANSAATAANTASGNANTALQQMNAKLQEIEASGPILQTEKGTVNGVATLDEEGSIPASQIPFGIRISAANMADRLTYPRNIDGMSFDGTTDINHYGICNTSVSVVAKTATLSGFKLVSGAKAVIKFTYGSTATSPTLNISSTGAKAIYYKGAAVPSGLITANAFVELVYDGTRYNIVGDLAQAKINELESMLSVTDITSSFSPSTDKISISKAYKYGKLVIVHGFLVAGYAQGWHTTETITTSYPPLTNASFIMGSQNSGDQTAGIKLDYRPSGTVYGTVSAALTGNNLFQLIYFTA